MYLYYDKNGTLKEQITYPVRAGASNVNKIYVYWEGSENKDIAGCWCRYRMSDGEYYPTIMSAELPEDDIVTDETIPYDQNRDLKYFQYGVKYLFYVFDIPDDVLANSIHDSLEVRSVLFGCKYMLSDANDNSSDPDTYLDNELVPMGLAAFALEPTNETVSPDFNINIAQWNELLKLIRSTQVGVTLDTNQTITGLKTFSNGIKLGTINEDVTNGLYVKDNKVYWNGTQLAKITEVVTLSGNQEITGNKEFQGNVTTREKVTVRREENPLVQLKFEDQYAHVDTYNIKANTSVENDTFDLELPQDDGTLALDKNTVNKTGNQDVNGVKTFKDGAKIQGNGFTVDVDAQLGSSMMQIHYYDEVEQESMNINVAMPDMNDGDAYDITLPADRGTLALTRDIENALKPKTPLVAVCTNNKYTFAKTTAPKGIYLFTYGNLFVIMPMYNMTQGITYKVVGPAIYDGDTGAVRKLIYNYRFTGTAIEIWTGETDYPLIDDWTGYLFELKLY